MRGEHQNPLHLGCAGSGYPVSAPTEKVGRCGSKTLNLTNPTEGKTSRGVGHLGLNEQTIWLAHQASLVEH